MNNTTLTFLIIAIVWMIGLSLLVLGTSLKHPRWKWIKGWGTDAKVTARGLVILTLVAAFFQYCLHYTGRRSTPRTPPTDSVKKP